MRAVPQAVKHYSGDEDKPLLMARHGSIGEFNAESEDWVSYTERLIQYFVANSIPEDGDTRRAILLSSCGVSTYQLIRNLVAPGKPTDKSFTEIVALVKDHHQPRPSTIVQRFNFHTRTQKPGESISVFVAQLRKLSEFCDFKDTLEDMLRDRLVCGCKDKRLQCKLLAEKDLTFTQALSIAKATETAEKEARDLQETTTAPVNSLQGGRKTCVKKPLTLTQALPQKASVMICHRCGGKHKATDCKFREAECHFCKKKGHIARACRNKQKSQTQTRTHQLFTDTTETADKDEYSLYHTQSQGTTPPIMVTLQVDGRDLTMELDTGATLSIVSEKTYKSLFSPDAAPKLKASEAELKTYTGEVLKILGEITVAVSYRDQSANLCLLVIAGDGPSLMGRNWLSHIRLDWKQLNQLNHVKATLACQQILDKHATLFKDELGSVQGVTAKFHINSDAQPKFFKPRPVPYALQSKVEDELSRLESAAIIKPVKFSYWAAPIVPVVKPDGSIRICGDYKVTINQASKTDTYPLPKIEDLFASLSGGQLFSKLDLASAYQQIHLEEESKEYTTINTHKGLFCYNRLPFGVASAPSIFQRVMDNILQGLKHVCVYLDDILITGPTEEAHLQNLDTVLTRLESAGMRLKRNKCAFLLPTVEYLGHKISAQGLQPTDEKIRAINNAPAPTDISQLKSFLGLINYYCKFLPNLSNTLAPLYRLLQKTMKWKWGLEQQKAFQTAKQSLTSDCLLVHFDPSKRLILACDASPYGIGAVLSHRMEDGSDKPIAFSSRTLAPAERKYSQLEKEGLAVVMGVKRFHQYLFGREFTIISDHKPLQHLFSESRVTPTLASARIQRWSLTLAAYNYKIQFKPGSQHSNADMLSRLPLPDSPAQIPIPGETILLLDMLNSLPVTAENIKQWTSRDPVLSRVRDMLLQGWQFTNDPDFKPYQRRKDELSVHNGCVLWGSRVVVPPPGRVKITKELHEGHPGVNRMKALARSFVWWPQLDSELENLVQSCEECQTFRHLPPVVPLQPWEWPQRPWARLHIDYAGPFLGKSFLILVDAHSKWIEVKTVTNVTSAVTIEHLRCIFATHGLPEMLVSDNGTVFTSAEFATFTKQNGIRHMKSAPYHPASNGLAERAVQTFKAYMKKATNGTIDTRVSRFLSQYRITPHSTTGISPAEMLLGRRPRTRLDLLIPDVNSKVQFRQLSQKSHHDQRARERAFQPGDTVSVRNFSENNWMPGVIEKASGPLSYQIKLEDGRIVRRHIDHILARPRTETSNLMTNDDWINLPDVNQGNNTASNSQNTPDASSQPPLRRSTRPSIPPKRYGQDNTT